MTRITTMSEKERESLAFVYPTPWSQPGLYGGDDVGTALKRHAFRAYGREIGRAIQAGAKEREYEKVGTIKKRYLG